MREQAAQWVEKWQATPSQQLITELHDFLREWLIDHILKADRELIPYFDGKEDQMAKALGGGEEAAA